MKKLIIAFCVLTCFTLESCLNDPPTQPRIILLQHKWNFDSIITYTNPRTLTGFEKVLNPPGSYYDFRVDNKVYQSGLYSFGLNNQNRLDTANYVLHDNGMIYCYKINNGIASTLPDSLRVYVLDDKNLILLHSSGHIGQTGQDDLLYYSR